MVAVSFRWLASMKFRAPVETANSIPEWLLLH